MTVDKAIICRNAISLRRNINLKYTRRHQTLSVYIECLRVYIAMIFSCRCTDSVAQCLCRLPCLIAYRVDASDTVSTFLSNVSLVGYLKS
jgi:hypothetical protein